MANSVVSAISTATTALLDSDIALANLVITGDQHIDGVRETIEKRCFALLARQQPVATDLRAITTAVRIVCDLERMGDLAAPRGEARPDARPPLRGSTGGPADLPHLTAGHIAERLMTKTATVIATRDVKAAAGLDADDDVMDELHRQLFRELLSTDWPHGIEAAIDVTLLSRYYELFADHAVTVARRVVYLVTGQRQPHPTAT